MVVVSLWFYLRSSAAPDFFTLGFQPTLIFRQLLSFNNSFPLSLFLLYSLQSFNRLTFCPSLFIGTMASADFWQFSRISLYGLSPIGLCPLTLRLFCQISPVINDNFLLIYLSDLHIKCSDSFGLRFVLQTRPTSSAFYPLPVCQAEILPPTSFRFRLTTDTLVLS